MTFLSIVIPVYNSRNSITPLLNSLISAKKVNFQEIELILVDDASQDNSLELMEKWLTFKGSTFKGVKIVCLKKNSGPALARNIGVRYAKGKIVLFLDSDVEVYSNTLFEIIRSFKNDPDLHALTGVWDKKQKGHRLFQKFKALRDWSYWINERDPRNYYYLFSTRVAAIDRQLFLRLGGFDTTYKAALVEDIELTYRIAKRYAVVFDPKAIVHHEFEDFWPIFRKYFWRSYYWSRIYRERKKFDPVATTGKEAVTTVSAGGLVGLAFLYLGMSIWGLVFSIKGANIFLPYIQYTIYFILFLHLFGVRKFLWFVYKEEGLLFAFYSFFTGIALYLAILSGAVYSLLWNSRRN